MVHMLWSWEISPDITYDKGFFKPQMKLNDEWNE